MRCWLAGGAALIAMFGVAACGGSSVGDGVDGGGSGNGGTAGSGGGNSGGTGAISTGGSGGGNTGGSGNTAGTGVGGGCPGTQPSDGMPCGTPGLECDYGKCCPTFALCDGGRWRVAQAPCEAPSCPANPPANGSSCECSEGLSCSYNLCAPDGSGRIAQFSCMGETWFDSAATSCPPPDPLCQPGANIFGCGPGTIDPAICTNALRPRLRRCGGGGAPPPPPCCELMAAGGGAADFYCCP